MCPTSCINRPSSSKSIWPATIAATMAKVSTQTFVGRINVEGPVGSQWL